MCKKYPTRSFLFRIRILLLELASLCFAFLGMAGMPQGLAAIINVSTSSQFQAALNSAASGDEILLAAGTYNGKFTANGLTNVSIRSTDPNNRAVINAAGQNEGIKMSSISSVTISDLVVQGASANGINIDDGGNINAPSTNLTLRNLLVQNIGGGGNQDGIKLSGVTGFHVNQVQVIDWGNGGNAVDMVGSSNGLIENSFFQNNSTGAGAGVRPKGGSSNITIRANRFVSAGARAVQFGGSTGLQFFRPQPPGTIEASNIIAEGNVIIGSEAALAYVNVADGTFRRNYVYRPTRWVMRVLKENNNPGFVDTQNGQFSDNVIEWQQGDLVRFVNVGPNTLSNTFQFAENQWYNSTDPGSSTPNLPTPEVDGIIGVDPQLDIHEIVSWDFGWGTWLVNAVENENSITIGSPEDLRLATPGDGATLNIGLAYPLVGDWTFSALPSAEVSVAPFSQSVLINAALLPPGDFDGDLDVDGNDFLVWQRGGSSGGANAGDLNTWQENYGTQLASTSAGSAVPEPLSLVLGLLAVVVRASVRFRV